MSWLKKMAQKQSRLEPGAEAQERKQREMARREKTARGSEDSPHGKPTPAPAPEELDAERRAQRKRKAAEASREAPSPVQAEAPEGSGKLHELKEALHRGDAVTEKRREAILARIGRDLDKHEAARLLRELEDSWLAEREVIKSRLRALDPGR